MVGLLGCTTTFLGLIVVNEMEKRAYSEKKVEKNPWLYDDKPAVSKVSLCF